MNEFSSASARRSAANCDPRRLCRAVALLVRRLRQLPPSRPPRNPAWDRTLERIASSIVTIEIDQTRAFDTEWNQSSQATGFVVDAERGLILTNRHVVTPGPVVATAVFLNREEVELHAVYRDPVHDFGIYRYDPRSCATSARRAAAVSGGRAASAPRSASSATTPASSCRSWTARWRGSIARRPIRRRQVQRLQHVLPAGRVGHLGRFVGLAGARHPRPRGGAERRRQQRRAVELLPAARSREARAGADPARPSR